MAATPTTTNAHHAAALQYAARGWHVLPLHNISRGHCTCPAKADCTSPAKHPRTKHGLHDATTDPGQIGFWWIKWPNANVGIRTGAISGLVVLDIDPEHDGEQSVVTLEQTHGPLPPTLTSLTGGDGMHHLYTHPGPDIDIANRAGSKLGPGIDVRGDGGYIVAPPSLHLSGQRYEWLDLDVPLAPLPDWLHEQLEQEQPVAPAAPRPNIAPGGPAPGGTTNYARVALDRQAADVTQAAQGGRNHALNAAAFRMGQLIAGGQIDEPTVVDELVAAAGRCGLGGKEVGNTIRSGLTSGAREPQYPDPTRASIRPSGAATTSANTGSSTTNEDGREQAPPDDTPPPAPPARSKDVVDDDDDPDGEINETDLGNARRLIRRHGHELRYATHLRGWLRWDGRRWRVDEDGYVQRCMHATAQSIMLEIAELADPDDRKKRFGWALKSENARALEAAIRIASSLRGTPVVAQQLDADPWLFNVRNGTIDLRTGDLREHRQTDLLTKLAPVTYDPDAHDDRWDAYLDSALPDAEFRDWVQRAIGYTLTGSTIEEILLFVHGPTRSGKSTFLEAIKAMFGDYAKNADFETFLDRGKDGTARSDIARLAGARLVTSNEIDEGRKLAEGLVKTLTGGDTITARFLYRDEFEYAPQFKLLLAANHKPRAKGNDDALWRRIRLLPFVHPPTTIDPGLKTHLSTDDGARSAILRWATDGCRQWRERGLRTVAAVREATQAYRAEQDPLAEFFADHCVFDNTDPNCCVTAADLRSAYEDWAKEQGIKRTLSPMHFKELLEDRGCTNERRRCDGKQVRAWRGIRMLAPNEDPQLPGIGVSSVTPDEIATEVPDTGVTASQNEEARDARDEQNHGSHDSLYVRAHEGEVLKSASSSSRASHDNETGATPLPGTFPEPTPEDDPPQLAYGDGYVPCANCERPILPAPGSVERGYATYCPDCQPF